jgi:hypothetical protein
MVVPEIDLQILPIREFFHPIQPLPLIGIKDDEPLHFIVRHLMGQDEIKCRLMSREKLFDIFIGHFRDNPYAAWIEEGCRNNRSKSIKIGVFVGRSY